MNITQAVAQLIEIANALENTNGGRSTRDVDAIRTVLDAFLTPGGPDTLVAEIRAELGTKPASQVDAYRSTFDATVAEMMAKPPPHPETLRQKIERLLAGIDMEETAVTASDYEAGVRAWWPSSEGAEFGRATLAAIREALDEAEKSP